MSHLVPKKVLDKNGVLTTRHVRATAASASPQRIPTPTKTSSPSKFDWDFPQFSDSMKATVKVLKPHQRELLHGFLSDSKYGSYWERTLKESRSMADLKLRIDTWSFCSGIKETIEGYRVDSSSSGQRWFDEHIYWFVSASKQLPHKYSQSEMEKSKRVFLSSMIRKNSGRNSDSLDYILGFRLMDQIEHAAPLIVLRAKTEKAVPTYEDMLQTARFAEAYTSRLDEVHEFVRTRNMYDEGIIAEYLDGTAMAVRDGLL